MREREGSVASSTGGSQPRKPRQNLDEKDHLCILRHCHEQKGNYKEGSKTLFWTGVGAAFQRDTGKVLAQLSATVGRLVEARRRQISDWEHGVLPAKPGGELNDALDEWMVFLKEEDGDAEEKRNREVEQRRRADEQRKEARRQAIAAESYAASQQPVANMRNVSGPPVDGPVPPAQYQHQHPPPAPQGNELALTNGNTEEMNGYRPAKRRRITERQASRELQNQLETETQAYQYSNALSHPPEPPRRVLVEGAMTKEDWRDVMGNDARLRALETKVDKIELLITQNNKLLLQLVQNQSSVRDRNEEEDRVPVHLDAEFERDYL